MLFSSASHGQTCSARGHCEAWQDENRNRNYRKEISASRHGVPAGNAEEYSRRGPESLRSLWRKNDMDLLSMLLPHRQRNFAGHPDKCPAEALPRNKAPVESTERSDHPAAVMAIQAKKMRSFRAALPNGGRPSPHQETEAIASARNTEHPCSYTL